MSCILVCLPAWPAWYAISPNSIGWRMSTVNIPYRQFLLIENKRNSCCSFVLNKTIAAEHCLLVNRNYLLFIFYFRLHKAYEAVEIGNPVSALTDLTGCICEHFRPDTNQSNRLFHTMYKSSSRRYKILLHTNVSFRYFLKGP